MKSLAKLWSAAPRRAISMPPRSLMMKQNLPLTTPSTSTMAPCMQEHCNISTDTDSGLVPPRMQVQDVQRLMEDLTTARPTHDARLHATPLISGIF